MEIFKRNLKNYEIIVLKGKSVPVKDCVLFKNTVKDLLETGKTRVAVNFQEINMLSSDLIGEIISVYHQIHAMGGEFVLIGSNVEITETLQLVGISTLISIYLDEESFAKERLS
jgi:anti-anti-sigma factor